MLGVEALRVCEYALRVCVNSDIVVAFEHLMDSVRDLTAATAREMSLSSATTCLRNETISKSEDVAVVESCIRVKELEYISDSFNNKDLG